MSNEHKNCPAFEILSFEIRVDEIKNIIQFYGENMRD
jgi:hypothetical protein